MPDENNNIKFAVCYIWSGHTDEMIKALASECLFRSLGLPDLFSAKGQSLLKDWNKNTDLKSSRSDDGIPQHPSAIDKLFVRMLYDPQVRPGMTPAAVNDLYESYFINQGRREE